MLGLYSPYEKSVVLVVVLIWIYKYFIRFIYSMVYLLRVFTGYSVVTWFPVSTFSATAPDLPAPLMLPVRHRE